jgi:NTP pyrophosphatase (non-canonical NTP hydrolase)
MNLKDVGISIADFRLLQQESKEQFRKFGVQNHDIFKWFAILTEEVGELAEAILQGKYNKAWREAISVSTVALKIAVMLRKR